MKKPLILALYGVALYFILRSYYKNTGETGLPNPRALAAPTYLYGILALTSDFLGGVPIVLAGGLTVALIWQANGQSPTAKVTPKPQAKVG